jgi:hypothetical protein
LAHTAGSAVIGAFDRSLSPPNDWRDNAHRAPTDFASPPDTTCYDAAQDVLPSLPFANPAVASRQAHNVPQCLIDDISPNNSVALAT